MPGSQSLKALSFGDGLRVWESTVSGGPEFGNIRG